MKCFRMSTKCPYCWSHFIYLECGYSSFGQCVRCNKQINSPGYSCLAPAEWTIYYYNPECDMCVHIEHKDTEKEARIRQGELEQYGCLVEVKLEEID